MAGPENDSVREHLGLIFLRGLVWGMTGIVYAPLFVGLRETLLFLGFGGWAPIPSAALAGAAAAAVYASMPIAVIATLVGIVSSTVYLVAVPEPIGLLSVALVSALAGGFAGFLLRFPARFSHGVPADAIAGLATGAGAGLLVALIAWMYPQELNIGVVVGLTISATGILWVGTEPWWITRIEHGLSRNTIEVIVSAVLAGLAGGSIWAVGGPVLKVVDPANQAIISRILDQIPAGVVGGIIGAAAAGMLLQALASRWVR